MLLTISVGPIISKSTGPMVGRPVVVDQSEISFLIPQGTLPWQFCWFYLHN